MHNARTTHSWSFLSWLLDDRKLKFKFYEQAAAVAATPPLTNNTHYTHNTQLVLPVVAA